jgi:hypothetical protein
LYCKERKVRNDRKKYTTTYPVCKNSIKCLDNTGRMPPFRRFNLVGDGCGRGSALRLNLANGSESASWKSLLEFTANGYMNKIADSGQVAYLGTE